MTTISTCCFKTYEICGRVLEELSGDTVCRPARGLVEKPQSKITQRVDERFSVCSYRGEINHLVQNLLSTLPTVLAHHLPLHPGLDEPSSSNLELFDWHFSLRSSNTEPLLHLNLESRVNPRFVVQSVAEIERLIKESPCLA